MPLKKIITIGYEGADPDDFLETLGDLGVTLLLDIRELPMSRRRGFAKTALRTGLEGVGIEYRHEPGLGSPRDMRHELRDDGDLPKFFKSFDRHLKKQSSLLEQLESELSGTVALLCYEKDFNTCHRRSVAKALGELAGLQPSHHGVRTHADRQAAARSRANPRKSSSAA